MLTGLGWSDQGVRFADIDRDGREKHIYSADIDGDGLTDYLWVIPDRSEVRVWYNPDTPSGPRPSVYGGSIATGIGLPAEGIFFARMGTTGRYDYVIDLTIDSLSQ